MRQVQVQVQVQISFVLTLLFGVFSLLLWWHRREDLHLWFGLSMLCFAAYTPASFIRQTHKSNSTPLQAPSASATDDHWLDATVAL